MDKPEHLEIDGAFGEGGGSILRLSAAFSILFNQPIKLKNIRANRPNPGLRLQHLLGLQTLAKLTGSELSSPNGECKVGTQELYFTPNLNIKNNIKVNVETAASIGLLLQPIQISALKFIDIDKIEILINGGGTFGKWAPSLNYLMNVTYQILRKSGLNIILNIDKYGFYPKGGGLTKCIIFPPKARLKPINLKNLDNIDLIEGEIILTNQLKQKGRNIGKRIKNSIETTLKKSISIELNIKYHYVDSISPGVALCLWTHSDNGAIVSSGTVLGEKKISSEQLGKTAARKILKYIENNIPVDVYLSDQLIPYMAYLKEASTIRVLEVSNHTKTNLELVKLFTNRKYEIIKEKNSYLIQYF